MITRKLFKKFRTRLIGRLFPFTARFFWAITLVLALAAWCIPGGYWRVRMVLLWIWLAADELCLAGMTEHTGLSVPPGHGAFYAVYRFVNGALLFFLPVLLVVLLLPGLEWLKDVFLALLGLAWLFRAVGSRRDCRKKPEE